MSYVTDKFNEGKLIIRAVDLPELRKKNNENIYDCSIWATEFELMMNNEFDSVSSTLLIPNIGVETYKNVGFLVDSDLAVIQHIALSDSGSSGSFKRGDFKANKPDFDELEQLANYIRTNNHTTMNEVNIAPPLNSVVGLVVKKCNNELRHLKRMMAVRSCLYQLTGIEYDIYEYDGSSRQLNQIELTEELMESINSIPGAEKYYYYTDYSDEIYEGNVEINRNLNK